MADAAVLRAATCDAQRSGQTASGTLVVKLGGSLLRTGRLAGAVKTVCRAQGPHVIVPGGGPFADTVRAAQTETGFSDDAAHRMALLAMDQMAVLIADMAGGRAALAGSLDEISLVLRQGRVAVWQPGTRVAQNASIPATWDVTSDSLALWLCQQMRGAGVALVKSAPVPSGDLSLAAQRGTDLLDAGFERMYQRSPVPVRLLNADAFIAGRDRGDAPGSRVVP